MRRNVAIKALKFQKFDGQGFGLKLQKCSCFAEMLRRTQNFLWRSALAAACARPSLSVTAAVIVIHAPFYSLNTLAGTYLHMLLPFFVAT